MGFFHLVKKFSILPNNNKKKNKSTSFVDFHSNDSSKRSTIRPSINSNDSILTNESDKDEDINHSNKLTYRQRQSLKRKNTTKKYDYYNNELETLYTTNLNNDKIAHHQQKSTNTELIKNGNKKDVFGKLPAERNDIKNNSKVNDTYSSLYSPFDKAPKVLEDDYIPLPTVSRKYIDRPPDSIIDSIIPTVKQSRKQPKTTTRQKTRQKLVIDTSNIIPPSSSKSNTQQQEIESQRHGQMESSSRNILEPSTSLSRSNSVTL